MKNVEKKRSSADTERIVQRFREVIFGQTFFDSPFGEQRIEAVMCDDEKHDGGNGANVVDDHADGGRFFDQPGDDGRIGDLNDQRLSVQGGVLGLGVNDPGITDHCEYANDVLPHVFVGEFTYVEEHQHPAAARRL